MSGIHLTSANARNGHLLLLCQRCAKFLGWRCVDIEKLEVPESKYVCGDCGKEMMP